MTRRPLIYNFRGAQMTESGRLQHKDRSCYKRSENVNESKTCLIEINIYDIYRCKWTRIRDVAKFL